jgi:hypothetical protein
VYELMEKDSPREASKYALGAAIRLTKTICLSYGTKVAAEAQDNGGLMMKIRNSLQKMRNCGYFVTGVTKSSGAGKEDVWMIKVRGVDNRDIIKLEGA